LKYDPNDATAHNNYGFLLSETGRMKEAEEHYKLSLKHDPNNKTAHRNYGLLLSEMGRMKEAEEHYNLAGDRSMSH